MAERQKGKGLIVRYVLTKTAKGTTKLATFDKDVEMVARQSAGAHFDRAIDKAFATAK